MSKKSLHNSWRKEKKIKPRSLQTLDRQLHVGPILRLLPGARVLSPARRLHGQLGQLDHEDGLGVPVLRLDLDPPVGQPAADDHGEEDEDVEAVPPAIEGAVPEALVPQDEADGEEDGDEEVLLDLVQLEALVGVCE